MSTPSNTALCAAKLRELADKLDTTPSDFPTPFEQAPRAVIIIGVGVGGATAVYKAGADLDDYRVAGLMDAAKARMFPIDNMPVLP